MADIIMCSAGEDHRGDAGEPDGRPHPSLRWPRHRPCQQGLLQAPQQVVVREATGRGKCGAEAQESTRWKGAKKSAE
jgi:hypothetical protein